MMTASRRPRKGRPQPPAPSSGMRAAVERRTAPLLVALLRVPRWLIFLVAAGLALAGFAAPKAFGVAALVVLALLMG